MVIGKVFSILFCSGITLGKDEGKPFWSKTDTVYKLWKREWWSTNPCITNYMANFLLYQDYKSIDDQNIKPFWYNLASLSCLMHNHSSSWEKLGGYSS